MAAHTTDLFFSLGHCSSSITPTDIKIWRDEDRLWAVWHNPAPASSAACWFAHLPAPVTALPYESLQCLPLWVIEAVWKFVSHECCPAA